MKRYKYLKTILIFIAIVMICIVTSILFSFPLKLLPDYGTIIHKNDVNLMKAQHNEKPIGTSPKPIRTPSSVKVINDYTNMTEYSDSIKVMEYKKNASSYNDTIDTECKACSMKCQRLCI